MLLLQKEGVSLGDNPDPVLTSDLSTSKYSPRVLQLLDSIVSTLQHAEPTADGKFIFNDAISDVTSDSSDDECSSTELSAVDIPALSEQLPHSAYKSKTEIAISRIFDLGKFASVADASIPAQAPYHGPSLITMTGFGELGRYGNQVLQYIFLKSYAIRHNITEIQVPAWVGASLFGLDDRQVQRALPSVVEFSGTLANSTFTDEFIDYVKRSNKGTFVPELSPNVLTDDESRVNPAPRNVDLWGWFQWHTSHFAPFKDVIQDTFSPVAELEQLHTIFNEKLRYRDGKKRTVVGLHLRLGDYQNIAASSFGYCAPSAWYIQWLDEIWPTLENPVLFVASDDIDAVRKDFEAYDVMTADSIGLEMPQCMNGLKAGFFPDWFGLTQCDVLAISNSTFSFTACMMNQRKDAHFFRAHYHGVMQPFDPWNADPIVHRNTDKTSLAAAVETLQIVYNTQGSRGLAKNIFYEIPYYAVRAAIMKVVFWRKAAKLLTP